MATISARATQNLSRFNLDLVGLTVRSVTVNGRQPEVAASWFPVNDHPIDKASYTFVVTAPADLQVVANGRLVGRQRHRARRTWVWNAPEPMASYLATVDPQFIRLAERVSGQQLDDLFRVWLFTGSKPVLEPAATAQATAAASSAAATLERARGTGRLRR